MSAARFAFLVVLVASAGAAIYGLFVDKTGGQILIAVIGLAVLGLALMVLSLWFARVAIRAGRAGSLGRALGSALIGGLVAFAASGALGAAVIFGAITLSA